ncbi:uncharacterized protein LOC128636260 [Bombina bombina]|uniref:uncharacterized protein LOC128636260 n=1 Tax=Bombina bombina TaxID=8345 RepID=UPI00235B277A|nr:uncharacterized protein LOC128636260 [Bombina bombina]
MSSPQVCENDTSPCSKIKILKKIASYAGVCKEVENVGSTEQKSPIGRRFLNGRKRIGRLARFLLSIAPQSLQCALGFHSADFLAKSSGSEEVRKSPLKPSGKGSKRKQDDIDIMERHSWVPFMNEDLPDEDQVDDLTYEPSNSETDSEEHHSINDTESDLEVEEKDGVKMLKKSQKKTEEVHNKEESVQQDNQTSANEEQKANHEEHQPNSSTE